MAGKKVATVTESYTLPSKGILYAPDGGTYPPDVVIRSMTTFEEKMRLGNQGFWNTMCSILDAVVTSPEEFEAKYMTLFDFYFLMYKMRTVSYGNIYKVKVTCPNCGKQVTCRVDLDKLEVNYLPEDFVEPFKIGPLPRSKDVLECRFDRVIDSINNDAKAKEILSKSPDYIGDPLYILNKASRIVTINGETKTPIEIQKYVEEMQAIDSAYYDQAYNRVVNGIGMNTVCIDTCSSCGEELKFELPFNSEFFRPTFDF